MSQIPTPEAVRAARRAVARIRTYGVDGPRPIQEIEALVEYGDGLDEALRVVLHDAGPDDLPAALHLVGLMRRSQVLDAVREVAFEQPAGLVAKREALEALRLCGVEPEDETARMFAALEKTASEPVAESLAALMEWPDAWRRPALDEWLRAADAEQLSSVEIALGIQPDLDARLLDWIAALGTPAAAEVLLRFLADADDKERVKQAKRALHRLRSQGVEIEEPATATPARGFSMTIESVALQDARAYATSVDGSGARLVWVLWRAPSGGSRLLQTVVDDTTGLREAEIATVTRQGFRDYVAQIKENPTVMLQQVPLQGATRMVAAAAALTEELGGTLPDDYRAWAELAGVSPQAAGAAAIYEHVQEGEVRDDATLIDDSMKQLRDPHFQSWALEGAAIDAAAEEVFQAETSTLMVSDEQRRERMQEAIRDAVARSFDDETRRLYRGRLEIMAGMLWDQGRVDLARQVLAAAVGLTEIEDLFRGHAFARALAHRGVWLAYQDKQRDLEAERQRSRIVQP